MIYELMTIDLAAGTIGGAMKRLGDPPASFGARTLLGAWTSEIGRLNQLVTLWRSDEGPSAAESHLEGPRWDWLRPLGDDVLEVNSDAYAPFDFLPPVTPGAYGRFYELRSYITKPGTHRQTRDLWEKHLPERLKMSPLIVGMVGLGGAQQRFVHIWAYDSLDTRHAIRAEAGQKGIWPPPGGPKLLQRMENMIMLPAPFSPLR